MDKRKLDISEVIEVESETKSSLSSFRNSLKRGIAKAQDLRKSIEYKQKEKIWGFLENELFVGMSREKIRKIIFNWSAFCVFLGVGTFFTSLYYHNHIAPRYDSYAYTTGREFEGRRENKLLVLLLDFKNAKIQSSEKVWSSYVFGNDNGCANNYFLRASQGRFKYVPAKESYGKSNDGVIKVKLEKNMDVINKNGDRSYGEWEMAREALEKASKYINFSKFDSNKDGRVTPKELDILMIAGNTNLFEDGTTSFDGFREHANSIKGDNIVDGVRVGEEDGENLTNFALVKEVYEIKRNELTGPTFVLEDIGTITHELAHTQGAVDVYDNSGKTGGVADFSLMGSGSTVTNIKGENSVFGLNPTDMDPWTKIKLGYVKPTVVRLSLFNPVEIHTLHSITSTKGRYNVIKIVTSDPREYFLVENRQCKGLDSGLGNWVPDDKKAGILVWHVHEGYSNDSNDRTPARLLDIEESWEGRLGFSPIDTQQKIVKIASLKGWKPKAAKPGANLVNINNPFYSNDVDSINNFGPDTKPNSDMYDGEKTFIDINVIDPTSDDMDVMISFDSPFQKAINNSNTSVIDNVFLENSEKLNYNTRG